MANPLVLSGHAPQHEQPPDRLLGERLRLSTTASKEDRETLQLVIADYDGPLQLAQDRIREELGLRSEGRLKTEKTTVEKLRRHRTRLSTLQDLAGLRIINGRDTGEQAVVARRIRALFPGAVVDDRRRRPSSGYRALHVILTIDGMRVEVQIRSPLQHAWAEAFEKLADSAGRGIRYGQPPDDPDAGTAVQGMLNASQQVADIERARRASARHRAFLSRVSAATRRMRPREPDTAEQVEALRRRVRNSRERHRRRQLRLERVEARMVEGLEEVAKLMESM